MHAFVCYHACMARQLTIRGVSEELGHRLETLAKTQGRSVNATVLQILSSALGYSQRRRRLERFATWTEEDRIEFEKALADQRKVDEELWR